MHSSVTWRSLVSVALVLAAGAILFTAIARFRSHRSAPSQGRWGLPLHTYTPKASDEYNDQMSWLLNDVAQRSRWTITEANALRDLAVSLADQYSEPGRDVTIVDIEPDMIHSIVVSLMGDWLRIGAPIDPEARRIVVSTLLQMLDHSDMRVRRGAVASIATSGLLDDPSVRARLEQMRDRDPDKSIAALADRHLRLYDQRQKNNPGGSSDDEKPGG